MVQRQESGVGTTVRALAAPPWRIAVIEALSAGLCGTQSRDSGLLQQGLAMRDAVAADLARVPAWSVAIAVDPTRPVVAPCSLGAETFAPCPDDCLAEFVRRTAQDVDAVWVIAPETDRLLASAYAATPTALWIGCSAAAIDLAASKSATLQCLHAAGVATPLAFAARSTQWVVKPEDGAGADATKRHDHHGAAIADREDRIHRGESAVLEPWVDGDALSLSLRCAAIGTVELLSVNRQRIDIDASGHVAAHGVTIDVLRAPDSRHAALVQLARNVVKSIPGVRGFVGIDVVWNAALGPVAIEVNPRTTSAYVGLSAAIGRNIAADILADHLEVAASSRARTRSAGPPKALGCANEH